MSRNADALHGWKVSMISTVRVGTYETLVECCKLLKLDLEDVVQTALENWVEAVAPAKMELLLLSQNEKAGGVAPALSLVTSRRCRIKDGMTERAAS